MLKSFQCGTGQLISWLEVCDGISQCKDNSDETLCKCVNDVYPCHIGYNVSCKRACNSIGYISCPTYRNWLACEDYLYNGDNLMEIEVIDKEKYDIRALYQLALIVTGVVGILAVIVAGIIVSRWNKPESKFGAIAKLCRFRKGNIPNPAVNSTRVEDEVRYIDMDRLFREAVQRRTSGTSSAQMNTNL